MNASPPITVLLSVHNGMPFLPQAVESILAQSLTHFEFLIIDDGSTDDTPAYLRSLADPRVRVERLEKVGLPAALNHGLRRARGRYIARLDADDIAYPTRLEKQLAYIQERPGCVLISCHFDCIDDTGRVIGEGINPVSDAAARWMLLFTTPFVHPGAMFDREHALAVGGYNPGFRLAQDYELWARLATRGCLGNYPDKLIAKRLHGAMHGGTNAVRQRELASEIAGRYAASVLPAVDSRLATALYKFLWWGELGPDAKPADLVDLYLRLRGTFRTSDAEADGELGACVQHMDEFVRARCLTNAKDLRRPWSVGRWLRLARQVDPVNSSLCSLAKSQVRRAFGRPRTETVPVIGVRYFL